LKDSNTVFQNYRYLSKYMIFHLVSYWINWIIKKSKLKLFLLVYFFLTMKFFKNINIFLKIFSVVCLYILIFFFI